MKENSASLNGVSAELGVSIVKCMLLKVLNYCIMCCVTVDFRPVVTLLIESEV